MPSNINKKTQTELIVQLAEICEELGWVIGLPMEEDEDRLVDGLIIGTENFVGQVVSSYTNDYEIYAKDMNEEGMHEVETDKTEIATKKKQTLH